MRVFAACRLERRAAADLARLLVPLQATFSGKRFRWVAIENFHMTLRFFGEVSAESAVTIGRQIESVARTERPFDCLANAPIPFPERRPSVVVLPIESNGRLERLAQNCNAVFADGFGAPDKPFRAHLTVIRCRAGARFRAHEAEFSFPFVVSSVGLYESTPAAGSVRYTALYEFELR